jgi:hypothetical protein
MEITSHSTKTAAEKLGVKAGAGNAFTLQSACIPLHPTQPEALKQVIQCRSDRQVYGEP